MQFNEHRFRQQVDNALATVKTVLDNTRLPMYAAETDHAYEDKYGLSEFLANAALAAQVNVLENMGVDDASLARLKEMATTRSVTLRLQAKETCVFVKEVEVEQEARTSHVKTEEHRGQKQTTTEKVITKVTEYHWTFSLDYSLYAFCGNETEDRVDLQSRQCKTEIVTVGNKQSPRPETSIPSPIDVPITWLLQNLSGDQNVCSFAIDRSAKTCRTPRRNEDIVAAAAFQAAFGKWGRRVQQYFVKELAGGVHRRPSPSGTPAAHMDLASINTEGLFVPVLPLFEAPKPAGELEGADATVAPTPTAMIAAMPEAEAAESSPLLPVGDINLFLGQQCRSLESKKATLTETFPAKEGDKLISVAEAALSMLCLHALSISEHFIDGVGYIEHMLGTQLVAAIGKELQPSDFAEFVRFHDKKLFKAEYAPEPFCYAIRRPDHYPDGTLSIENGHKDEPIVSITRKIEGKNTRDLLIAGMYIHLTDICVLLRSLRRFPDVVPDQRRDKCSVHGRPFPARVGRPLIQRLFRRSAPSRRKGSAVLELHADRRKDLRAGHVCSRARYHPPEQGRAHDPTAG